MEKRKQERTLKNIFYTILIAFGIVCFWRGVWGLMDLYLFPGNHALSFSISILIGILILYLTKNLLDKLT
ncbi:MAG: hypothetical protein KJ646_04970 [Nanoarchaeota archaeon]|nr:hypothetical protein [Nanoarchaeota archaeon]MBU4116282.1 hypothetical protein [Nanoarchaeota archaeon]